MIYKTLGKSGLPISALSLGSWLTFGMRIDNATAQNMMQVAYEKGVNFFDNAEIYANGQSEIVMGKALQNLGWDRTSYILSSKVYFGDGRRNPTQVGLHRKHIFEACDAALKRLQVEYLDLYFCHRPDKKTPILETVRAMNTLIEQGKIFYWGTSEWSAQEIMEAHLMAEKYHLIPPTMEQPQYNMLWRDKVEVEYSQIYKTVGLGTTIWSPLASGILTDRYLSEIPEGSRLSDASLKWLKERSLTPEKLEKIKALNAFATAELGVSLAKLAVAWCAANPTVSTVILGGSKVSQLEETLDALAVIPMLTPAVMEHIEGILENKPVPPPF
jgi:voltage-dependent potassium channel beta subunit